MVKMANIRKCEVISKSVQFTKKCHIHDIVFAKRASVTLTLDLHAETLTQILCMKLYQDR